MIFTDEVKAACEALSPLGREFLEFVERHPECLDRSTFAALDRQDFLKYPMQSWPVFVDLAKVRKLERVSVGLCRMIRSLPERVFENDAARLGQFYHLDRDQALLISTILDDSAWIDGVLTRGDYVLTPSGLKCLELNATSTLGGWQNVAWADFYLQVPMIARFLEGSRARAMCRSTVRSLFLHLLREAQEQFDLVGELNLVFAIPLDNRGPALWLDYARCEYERFLAEESGGELRGEFIACSYEELDERDGWLMQGNCRIHLLVEMYNGTLAPAVFRTWAAGRLKVYNGPLGFILSDKGNLALLSELQDSHDFDASERDLIARHVPWTRLATQRFVTFEGRRSPLADLLVKEQARFVLKPRWGGRGIDVHVGAFTPRDRWSEIVAQALAENDYVVQEYVESVAYAFQDGAYGWREHDMVWGLFAFGDLYGGGFLRMSPRGEHGVINAAQGASEGVFFEIGDLA